MPESAKRAKANKANAELSTGPKSAIGKANSSANALTHGVLSRKLLSADENTEEFNELLASPLSELEPVGTMEQLLVERVAASIWRQRRMVGAEAASVAEQQ